MKTGFSARCWILVAALLMRTMSSQPVAAAPADDALDRFTADRLAAVHDAVAELQARRQEHPRRGPLQEFRANLHVHSAFSHDSRGTIEEIVAAARAVGTQVLMFTEHPAAHYDFFEDGHQGMRDGVLLIPGAEAKGLLVFPKQSVRGFESEPVQSYSDLIQDRGGLTFLSHLEERMDWQITGLTGLEIYNTHADFKDEKRLLASLRNPLWLLKAADLCRKYPQEAYSSLQHYPADYLKRWDELCLQQPHTGVSANDAHQNIGISIRMAEGQKLRVEDAAGDKLLELDAAAMRTVVPGVSDATVGSELFRMRLDPYENSLHHVATHLLMPELTQEAVWQALRNGRAFVAFDWMASARGFEFFAESAGVRFEMGDHPILVDTLRLTGRAPLPAVWKLIRNGQTVSESSGMDWTAVVQESGNYRVELWLEVAGDPHLWILSNPIYVAAPQADP